LFDGIALLSGGSYAQWAVIPKTHVMNKPANLSFKEVEILINLGCSNSLSLVNSIPIIRTC
jgi:NADPH:quinone reductase-like Zn-dependent oxidoreductase